MELYPRAETDRRVPRATLLDVVTRVFAGCGMADADAGLLAETLVSSDMRGVHSNGVLRVHDYVAKLTREGVDPAGSPRVISRKGGALRVDGGNSMGQIGGTFAMDAAIEAARPVLPPYRAEARARAKTVAALDGPGRPPTRSRRWRPSPSARRRWPERRAGDSDPMSACRPPSPAGSAAPSSAAKCPASIWGTRRARR